MAKSKRKTGLISSRGRRERQPPPVAADPKYSKARAVKLKPKTRLGLLDLSPGIRVLIYSHLLTFEHHINDPGAPVIVHCEVPQFRVHDISSRNERLSPSTVAFKSFDRKRTGCNMWPEILRTCRLIHREASPFLSCYAENRFWIRLNSGVESHRSPKREDLMCRCHHIFTYDEEQWQNLQVPDVFQDNLFAAFLAKAGPKSARQISNIRFIAEDCDVISEQMPLITELARLHMPGLCEVEVYVCKKEFCYDESPDYYHPDRSSPFWMNGLFRPMYEALADFIDQVPWLRSFTYDGQSDFGHVDDGPVIGLDQLKRLEQKVRDRSMGEPTVDTPPFGDGLDETAQSGYFSDKEAISLDVESVKHDMTTTESGENPDKERDIEERLAMMDSAHLG